MTCGCSVEEWMKRMGETSENLYLDCGGARDFEAKLGKSGLSDFACLGCSEWGGVCSICSGIRKFNFNCSQSERIMVTQSHFSFLLDMARIFLP